MASSFRLQVKFFLENAEGVDLAAFGGLFQRWIQQNALNELLIDVADYRHVFNGPGIILIGHENDYGVEKQGDRIGLLFTRKRQIDPDLRTQLRVGIGRALAACERLEAESAFTPRLKFRASEIEIRLVDRLHFRNRAETFEAVRGDLEAALAELYGDHPFQFAPVEHDERKLFTVKVQAEGVENISDLFRPVQLKAE